MKLRKKEIKVFTVNMTDIEKVLKIQQSINFKIKLSTHYYKFLDIFD